MTTPTAAPSPAKAIKSPQHRVIFANLLGMRAGDNDFQIVFSIEHGGGENVFLEETTVVVTPKTAKLLHEMLGKTLIQVEKEFGPIKMPDSVASLKLERLEKRGP